MITFKKQFDKLTEAYIRGEVKPYQECACFVGNLLNNTDAWGRCRTAMIGIGNKRNEKGQMFYVIDHAGMKAVIAQEAEGFYEPSEITELETRFMNIIYKDVYGEISEDILFEAFSATLDLLKQIHESKGEVVEPFEFVKRQPVNV